jgi:glycosyltransferase involved in cell wall biosynthesis
MQYLGLVAIITRTKDRPLLLERAINSVLSQTINDWHMVIVNDGGDPSPVDELVSRYQEQFAGRVSIIHNRDSLGMEAASNRGIAHGTSKYLVIHDDDDSWSPQFLKFSINELEQQQRAIPSIRGIVSHSVSVTEHIDGGAVIIDDMGPWNERVPTGLISLTRMAEDNMFAPISFLYEREALERIGGGYREDLPVLGDWEFNLRFLSRFEIYCVAESLSFYHLRPSADGIFGNSIINGRNKHEFYRQFLHNQMLREDMNSGRTGIGVIANLLDRFGPMAEMLSVENKRLLNDERDRLLTERDRLAAQCSLLSHDLDAIRNSRSWRMLGFARKIGTLAKKALRRNA